MATGGFDLIEFKRNGGLKQRQWKLVGLAGKLIIWVEDRSRPPWTMPAKERSPRK
jgi:hypothetical protein